MTVAVMVSTNKLFIHTTTNIDHTNGSWKNLSSWFNCWCDYWRNLFAKEALEPVD